MSERARSISPSKTGPPKTLSVDLGQSFNAKTSQALNPPVDFTPQNAGLSRSNAVNGKVSPTRSPSTSPTRAVSSSPRAEKTPLSTASGLARSGTLSWQQRPQSRDGAHQSRSSGFTSMRNTPATPEPAKENNDELDRAQIAASLAQKNPTWFRQTQERGFSSAAYRKNQIEGTQETPASRSIQLHGMSTSREPSRSPAPMSTHNVHSTRASAEVKQEEDRFKRGSTPDIAALRLSMTQKPSPTRPDSQDKIDARPLSSESMDQSGPNLARSSSVLSQNRPASPVKGFGGFVESAMMKRSDSVNKRWSVREGGGLRRGDSVAGARPLSLHSRGISRDIAMSRDESSSPRALSRPGSSHNEETAQASASAFAPSTEQVKAEQNHENSSPTAKLHMDETRPQTPSEDSMLSRSPSKTMDPRRWSPTKSSWLGSMLQQNAEPPKLQPLKEEQPKWKVDLQRSKSRASRDVSPAKAEEKKTSTALPAITSPPTTPSSKPTAFPGWSSSTTPVTEAPQSLSTKPVEMSEDDTRAKVEETTAEALADTIPQATTQIGTSEQAAPIPKQAPTLKPKPATPPKTDLRGNLKSRAPGATSGNGDEPEFKSMFGKLKRTTTQNYVAPDEFKTNILSGKAGLAVTGGPVKTKRVDEFKESILAKKDEMKTAPSKPVLRPDQKEKSETPVPEALARRKTLSKASAPDTTRSASSKDMPLPKVAQKPLSSPKSDTSFGAEAMSAITSLPSTVVGAKTISTKPAWSRSNADSARGSQPALSKTEKEPADTSKLSIQPATTSSTTRQSSLTEHKEAKPTPTTNRMNTASTSVACETPEPVIDTIPATTGLPASSKLASRLNPSLAAMLSRGPSPKPSSVMNDVQSMGDTSTTPKNKATASVSADDSLTHMTKARAKGPKRRAPKAEGSSTTKEPPQTNSTQPDITLSSTIRSEAETVQSSSQQASKREAGIENKLEAQTLVSKRFVFDDNTGQNKVDSTVAVKPSAAPIDRLNQPKTPVKTPTAAPSQSKQTIPELAPQHKPKPIVATKSADLRRVSSNSSMTKTVAPTTSPATPEKPASKPDSGPLPKPPTTKKTPASLESPKASPIMPAKSSGPQTSAKEDVKPPLAAAKSKPAIQGLDLKLTPSPKAEKFSTKPRTLTPPPDSDLELSKAPEDVRNVLESYLGPIDGGLDRAEFDASNFLTSAKSLPPRNKTSQLIVHELSGDGKKIPVSAEQQHVLYEDSMYLIVHKYTTETGGNAAEVHLWCGDRVADAAIEDVQIFCRRDAREHSAKLEVVKQGKESANFIQAFGGILIIRRSRSAALFMLCGRRHLSHIVFDEVDLDAASLCPGFVFLISVAHGKLFLWKGKGAGADEIGSARLIGMDLGLTGEIEEIEQGSEPTSFWTAIGGKKAVTWSDEWQQRTDTTSPAVLYRVEHERPGMLSNLTSWGLKRATSPSKQAIKANCQYLQSFTQNDLDTPTVHILDNYRALYVIVTRHCTARAAEFITALHIAQDIAMLSPAIQDRPVVPTCYIVAGDMPSDIKACFRKWSAIEGNSLIGKDSICVKLDDVMEALSL